MDEELLELQRQFEFAQQAKSSIRLSDRNVVELVQRLQQLQIIDFDLLHTVSGKEFITPDQLRHEMVIAINRKGRVSLIDLADITGVDLYHVEKQAERVVSEDPGLMLVQGEIISNSYWDTVAEEINERLQECSQIALAEIAVQLHVGSELVASMLEPRLKTLVKGRLEGGQLYTPAYVARVSAMVRGAARGITVPTNLSVLWSSLQQLLQEMDGATGVAVESVFFQSMFHGMVKEGKLLGMLRAGVHWTPAVFAIAQKECVDSFFSQNSFISYDALQKLGIPQYLQYLQSRYSEGIPLVTVFIHPSMIEMLDSAVEDAIERGSWIDSLSVLPTSFGCQDASKIVLLCPSVQVALKNSKALVLGDSCVFSTVFVKDIFYRVEKEMQSLSLSGSPASLLHNDPHLTKEVKVGHEASRFSESSETVNESGGNKLSIESGTKKKKGKASGNAKAPSAESGHDNQETPPHKSKKNQRRGKDTSSLGLDSKAGTKKQGDKVPKDDNFGIPSDEWVMGKIVLLFPEFEEQGIDDFQTILGSLADLLRPMLITSMKEKRKALFTENVEKIRTVNDNLQKKLDESLNMQLYEKALDIFQDDLSTSVILHKHLLRTTATPLVDALLFNLDLHNKLKTGINVEHQNPESFSLGPGDRISLAKGLPGALSTKALSVVEVLEGKRVETFITALGALAEESGLLLKKLDKKLERTLLHSYHKDLTSQVSVETDPVSVLPKVISLLYLQVYNKALQAPGRAISVAVSRLKDKLDDSAYKILMDYHSATVTLLALIAASTGDEEDCTSDRILSKREYLEGLMPALKGLVLSTSKKS